MKEVEFKVDNIAVLELLLEPVKVETINRSRGVYEVADLDGGSTKIAA